MIPSKGRIVKHVCQYRKTQHNEANGQETRELSSGYQEVLADCRRFTPSQGGSDNSMGHHRRQHT